MTKQTDKWQLVLSWGELFPDSGKLSSGQVATELNPDNGAVEYTSLAPLVTNLAHAANDRMIDIYAPPEVHRQHGKSQTLENRVRLITNATIELINKVTEGDYSIDFTETWSMEAECGNSVLTLQVVAPEGFEGNHTYSVDFTDEEMATIKVAAAKCGKTPEEYIQDAVTEAADKLTNSL